MTWKIFWVLLTGIRITDFQMLHKMSDTIKYLLGILKIHWTSCIMATFDIHKYCFFQINTYFINKPCIISFYFFFIPSNAKNLIRHMQEGPHKRRIKYITIIDKMR